MFHPLRFSTRQSGAALLLLLAACGATPADPASEPYTFSKGPSPDSIGYFLTEFDNSLRYWNNASLTARSEKDFRVLRGLERELTYRSGQRREELVLELESGPPQNRAIAAVALGFTGEELVLSPLLAALSDEDETVLQNALMGIGLLASPDTPVAPVAYQLRTHSDPRTRNNAAYALHRLAGTGVRNEELLSAARAALADEEPGVRAQAASLLGLLVDTLSAQALGDLLYDEKPLVSAAAASALAHLGKQAPETKGECARLLVAAFERGDGPLRRRVRSELVSLNQDDLGDEVDRWREWAYRLP